MEEINIEAAAGAVTIMGGMEFDGGFHLGVYQLNTNYPAGGFKWLGNGEG